MGSNTLNSNFTEGDDVLSSHIKQVITNRNGVWLPYLNNVPAAGQQLGDALRPWGVGHFKSLSLDGRPVDLSALTTDPNRIISGRAINDKSTFPNFFGYDDGSLTLKILCSATPLALSIAGESVVYDQDIEVAVAAGLDNSRTLTINDPNIQSNDFNFVGELDYVYGNKNVGFIVVDGLSNTGNFVGRTHGMKLTSSSQAFLMARLVRSTGDNGLLRDIVRKGFYTRTGASEVRGVGNNSQLKYIQTGWVFLDADKTIAPEITYREPLESFESPADRNVGEYWKDLPNDIWRRWNGQDWVSEKKIPIGIVFTEGNSIIGYKCFQFDKPNASNINTIFLTWNGDDSVASTAPAIINIAGTTHFIKHINNSCKRNRNF